MTVSTELFSVYRASTFPQKGLGSRLLVDSGRPPTCRAHAEAFIGVSENNPSGLSGAKGLGDGKSRPRLAPSADFVSDALPPFVAAFPATHPGYRDSTEHEQGEEQVGILDEGALA